MMKKMKESANGILMCLFEILVGILLLIKPVGFTNGIIIAFGIVVLAAGITNIVKYFRADAAEAAKSQSLWMGLVALLAGGFCVMKSQWFLATFPILTMIYGVVILVTGLGKVQWTVDMFRMKKQKWFLPAISAAISIICAVVILQNPFASTAVLWMFTGVSLIVEAVFDVIALFLGSKEK